MVPQFILPRTPTIETKNDVIIFTPIPPKLPNHPTQINFIKIDIEGYRLTAQYLNKDKAQFFFNYDAEYREMKSELISYHQYLLDYDDLSEVKNLDIKILIYNYLNQLEGLLFGADRLKYLEVENETVKQFLPMIRESQPIPDEISVHLQSMIDNLKHLRDNPDDELKRDEIKMEAIRKEWASRDFDYADMMEIWGRDEKRAAWNEFEKLIKKYLISNMLRNSRLVCETQLIRRNVPGEAQHNSRLVLSSIDYMIGVLFRTFNQDDVRETVSLYISYFVSRDDVDEGEDDPYRFRGEYNITLRKFAQLVSKKKIKDSYLFRCDNLGIDRYTRFDDKSNIIARYFGSIKEGIKKLALLMSMKGNWTAKEFYTENILKFSPCPNPFDKIWSEEEYDMTWEGGTSEIPRRLSNAISLGIYYYAFIYLEPPAAAAAAAAAPAPILNADNSHHLNIVLKFIENNFESIRDLYDFINNLIILLIHRSNLNFGEESVIDFLKHLRSSSSIRDYNFDVFINDLHAAKCYFEVTFSFNPYLINEAGEIQPPPMDKEGREVSGDEFIKRVYGNLEKSEKVYFNFQEKIANNASLPNGAIFRISPFINYEGNYRQSARLFMLSCFRINGQRLALDSRLESLMDIKFVNFTLRDKFRVIPHNKPGAIGDFIITDNNPYTFFGRDPSTGLPSVSYGEFGPGRKIIVYDTEYIYIPYSRLNEPLQTFLNSPSIIDETTRMYKSAELMQIVREFKQHQPEEMNGIRMQVSYHNFIKEFISGYLDYATSDSYDPDTHFHKERELVEAVALPVSSGNNPRKVRAKSRGYYSYEEGFEGYSNIFSGSMNGQAARGYMKKQGDEDYASVEEKIRINEERIRILIQIAKKEAHELVKITLSKWGQVPGGMRILAPDFERYDLRVPKDIRNIESKKLLYNFFTIYCFLVNVMNKSDYAIQFGTSGEEEDLSNLEFLDKCLDLNKRRSTGYTEFFESRKAESLSLSDLLTNPEIILNLLSFLVYSRSYYVEYYLLYFILYLDTPEHIRDCYQECISRGFSGGEYIHRRIIPFASMEEETGYNDKPTYMRMKQRSSDIFKAQLLAEFEGLTSMREIKDRAEKKYKLGEEVVRGLLISLNKGEYPTDLSSEEYTHLMPEFKSSIVPYIVGIEKKRNKKDTRSILEYNKSDLFKRNNAPVADSFIEVIRYLLLATNFANLNATSKKTGEKTVLNREYSLQYLYLEYKKGLLTEKLEKERTAAEEADQKRIAEENARKAASLAPPPNLDETVSNETDASSAALSGQNSSKLSDAGSSAARNAGDAGGAVGVMDEEDFGEGGGWSEVGAVDMERIPAKLNNMYGSRQKFPDTYDSLTGKTLKYYDRIPANTNITALRDWNQVNKHRKCLYFDPSNIEEMDRKRNDLFSTEHHKEALQRHGFIDADGRYVHDLHISEKLNDLAINFDVSQLTPEIQERIEAKLPEITEGLRNQLRQTFQETLPWMNSVGIEQLLANVDMDTITRLIREAPASADSITIFKQNFVDSICIDCIKAIEQRRLIEYNHQFKLVNNGGQFSWPNRPTDPDDASQNYAYAFVRDQYFYELDQNEREGRSVEDPSLVKYTEILGKAYRSIHTLHHREITFINLSREEVQSHMNHLRELYNLRKAIINSGVNISSSEMINRYGFLPSPYSYGREHQEIRDIKISCDTLLGEDQATVFYNVRFLGTGKKVISGEALALDIIESEIRRTTQETSDDTRQLEKIQERNRIQSDLIYKADQLADLRELASHSVEHIQKNKRADPPPLAGSAAQPLQSLETRIEDITLMELKIRWSNMALLAASFKKLFKKFFNKPKLEFNENLNRGGTHGILSDAVRQRKEEITQFFTELITHEVINSDDRPANPALAVIENIRTLDDLIYEAINKITDIRGRVHAEVPNIKENFFVYVNEYSHLNNIHIYSA